MMEKIRCQTALLALGAAFAATLGLSCAAASVSESATIVPLSTQGPDCYADGTPALDGEYYALVWQAKALDTVQFTRAGALVETNATVLCAVPRAKDARCPRTYFAIESDRLVSYRGGGRLRLYLLDTRTFASGVPAVGGLDSVQGAAAVTEPFTVSIVEQVGAADTQKLFAASALEDEAPNPVITGIRLEEGRVVLTVADSISGVNYRAVNRAGQKVGEVATGVDGGVITLSIPLDETASGDFFKVVRDSEF